jgi:hypothetical protein
VSLAANFPNPNSKEITAKVSNDPECHYRERLPSMGGRAMSGNGAKSFFSDS